MKLFIGHGGRWKGKVRSAVQIQSNGLDSVLQIVEQVATLQDFVFCYFAAVTHQDFLFSIPKVF